MNTSPTMWRRLIPYSLLPLALLATALASGLWLRAFPASVMAAPLFGACLISVLLPVAVAGLFTSRLWVTALLDAVALVLYLLFVVLRDPTGFDQLWTGIVHGPSQLLTFALPLVSPRSLLVAPVLLCWICGAIAGECIGRGWQTVLPYLAWLTTFVLTYAGTARAIDNASAGRRQDTLIGAALLLILLLIRAAQAWVGQDESAEVTQANGVLPVRGFVIGAVLALVLAGAAAGVVQSSTFAGPPETPQRVPSVHQGQPVTPLAFTEELRQQVLAGAPARPVFRVGLGGAARGYFAIASVDYYDGDAWSFQRTFRPSGGVIPDETDPSLHAGATVKQSYRVDGTVLTRTPWMPYVARPARVSGLGIDVDADSGMIVPAEPLSADQSYSVTSHLPDSTFDDLAPTAFAASSVGPADRGVPGQLRSELSTVIATLAAETGASSAPAIPFLQAVSRDLRTRYGLSGKKGVRPSSSAAPSSTAPSSAASSAPRRSHSSTPRRARSSAPHRARSSAHPSPPPRATSSTTSAPPDARTGGTGFRDVVQSILGDPRSGTPEQYATLVALVARQLGVPARVVTGFRVLPSIGNGPLPAGTYDVTTADAWTWVEVPVHGQGWVVLDPSPGTYSGSAPAASVGTQASPSPSSSSAPNALVTTDNRSGQAVAPRSKVPGSHGLTAAALLVIVLGGLIALAVALIVLLLVRKRLRVARRRRPSDPRVRLLGAWHESIDVLVEAGLPEPETMTSAEIAGATAAQFGESPGQHVTSLGEAANLAIFSPTSWVSSAEADAAWTEHWLLRTEVHRSLALRDRLAAGVRFHQLRERRRIFAPSSWADKPPDARTRKPARGGRHRN